MSVTESRISEAEERLNLLESVHNYITRCLPTLDDIRNGRFSVSSGDTLDILDAITLLRTDIKKLPITLQCINIEQAASNNNIDRLINAFDSLLGLFEESVQIEEISDENVTVQQGTKVFPKLMSLRNMRPRCEISREDFDSPKTENDARFGIFSDISGHVSAADTQLSMPSLGNPSSNIIFPPPQKTIKKCRKIVESFDQAIDYIFPGGARKWNAESLLQRVTRKDVTYIQKAQEFSRESSSLFQQLIRCINCGVKHTASLHLSGFGTTQIEMLLGTCDEDLIHTSFMRSSTAILSEKKFEHEACAHLAGVEPSSQRKRSCFDETTLSNDYTAESVPYDLPIQHMSSMTLDKLLQGLIPPLKSLPLRKVRRLDKLSRKVVGLLLACSLFQLCGSPWIQHEFERESIYLFPHPSNNSLHYWCPHISCEIDLPINPSSLPEDVAALGVLILELESSLTAGWTEGDEDYGTDTKSNRARLYRILKEWKDDVTNFYHGIGLSCLSFESLVEDFEHPDLDKELKKFTILYKCIVNPLFQQLVYDFPHTENLFKGISGLSVPTKEQKASTSSLVVLYDDSESSKPDVNSKYAQELIDELKTSFLQKIESLRKSPDSINLARTLEVNKTPERIRIAVLDTGIDPTDTMIKFASRSRIKDKRSWVGSIDNYEDEYGHGTHVTRLLLEMAPAAEIFVAKITTGKTIDAKDMGRIAKAIEWAVEEWKVHIISMSFGFETKNEAIEDAIEKAFKADILMFAAASNEGGNKKSRSHPGQSPKVICIHACDGLGNIGAMNPNPGRGYNFGALGVAVPSRWKKRDVYKSGTSFATPIAAAFAADILEYANFKCDLGEKDTSLLYRHEGMHKMFAAVSIFRREYDYLHPDHLWGKHTYNDESIAKEIQRILDE